MKCEICGKSHDGSYGSGRFCSKKCAHTRIPSKETIEKIRESVKNSYTKYEKTPIDCKLCGKEFYTRDHTRKLCYNCLPSTIRRAKIDKNPTTILELSKRTISKILKRMCLPCSCCGIYIDGIVFDLHHIQSVKNGGSNELNNLTYICPTCHRVAHTDINKLKQPLISLDIYLEKLNINWKDYYFGY